MSHSTRQRRRIAAVAAGGVVAVLTSFLGVIPRAEALQTTGQLVGSTTAVPEVFRDTANNPAGDLEIHAQTDINDPATAVPSTLFSGEQLMLEVSDGSFDNCTAAVPATHRIGFNQVPTITFSGTTNVSVDSVVLRKSTDLNKLRLASGSCATFPGTPTNDQVVVTVNAPPGGGNVTGIAIGGISYDVGALAVVGQVRLMVGFDDPRTSPPGPPPGGLNSDGHADAKQEITGPAGAEVGNAYITNLKATFGDAQVIRPGTGRTAPDITLAETDFEAATPDQGSVTPAPDGTDGNPVGPASDGVCITNDSGFTFTGTPTVTKTAGNDVPGPVSIESGGTTLRFGVTRVAPSSKTTFVVSGIKVNTVSGEFGPQLVSVFQCDAQFDNFSIVPQDENNPQSITDYTNNDVLFLTIVNSERYAGVNRNDTARVMADRGFPCGFNQFNPGSGEPDQNWAVIARNDDFADALSANYIAGQLYAPILLVNTHGPIPQETVDALRTHGVTDVVVMGGSNAVGDDVRAQLDALTSFTCQGAARRTPEDAIRTVNVQLVAGPTRFGTARAAALFTFGGNTIGFLDAGAPGQDATEGDHPLRTAILASGRNFPDAMVGGPMAFQGLSDRFADGFCDSRSELCDGYPILLSDGSSSTLPTDTQSLITDRNIEQVIIVGGTSAVPASVETALTAQGINVIRLGGANRQLTAIAVAKFEIAVLGFEYGDDDGDNGNFLGHLALARGDFFTDALAMGPVAGNDPSNTAISTLIESPGLEPILLTQDANNVGSDTLAFITELASNPFGPTGYLGPNGGDDSGPATPGSFGLGAFWIDIAGGTVAVSTSAENAALNAFQG